MRARTRFLLDLVIACGLIAAYQPGWTGISLHEWVSIAIIVPLAVHLVVNWEWCVRIARTFFQRLFHASRANFVVDSGLLIASVAVMLSGIMVSPIPSWFGLEPTQLLVWSRLHAWSANAIIALFAVHSALHWRWIVATAKRLAPQSPAFARGLAGAPAQPSGGLSAAQSRRAARLAAEKAATRRKAGALGVVGVTLALGSLIFASVAVAGPALSGSLSPRGAAVASAVTARASARSTASGTASASSTAAATRSAKARTSATVAPVTSAATQVCPRTGCSAITCHGTSGVSAGVWYKTHN